MVYGMAVCGCFRSCAVVCTQGRGSYWWRQGGVPLGEVALPQVLADLVLLSGRRRAADLSDRWETKEVIHNA